MKTRLENMWKEKIKNDVLVARLMIVVMLVYLVLPLMPEDIFANDNGEVKTLVVAVDKVEGLVGETFEYQIFYSYSSNNGNFVDQEITAELPEGMVISSYDGTSHIKDNGITVNGSKITFLVNGTGLSGATGVLSFKTKYPIGSIDEDTVVAVEVTGGDHDPQEPAAVGQRSDPVVTIKLRDVNANDMTVNKSVASPYNGDFNPIPGSTITYNVSVLGVTGNGAYNLSNTTVVDTLPAEATYVSSTHGGVHDPGTNKVTWTVGELDAGDSFSASVTVKYEQEDVSTNEADDNHTVVNSVTATATTVTGAEEETILTDTANVSVSFDAATPGIKGIAKNARGEAADTEEKAAEYSANQKISYTISGFGNNGNVPLDRMDVYDVLPDEIDIDTISASGATIYYATARKEITSEDDAREAAITAAAEADLAVTAATNAKDAKQLEVNNATTLKETAETTSTAAEAAKAEAIAAAEIANEDDQAAANDLVVSTTEAAELAASALADAITELGTKTDELTALTTAETEAIEAAALAAALVTSTTDAASNVPDYRKYDWIAYDSQDHTYKSAIALKFSYTNIGVGTTLSETFSPITLTADFIQESITLDEEYLNTAYVEGFATNYDNNGANYDSSTTVTSNKAYIEYVDELPIISMSKTASVVQIKDGERVTYTLRFTNSSKATGSVQAGDSFTIIDTLPLNSSDVPMLEDLIVNGQSGLSLEINGAGGDIDTTNDYTHTAGVGIRTLDFNLTGITIAPGASHTVVYSVKVKDGTTVGSYLNTADGNYTDADGANKVGPKTNLDSLLNKTDSIFVKFSGSLDSVKGVGYNIYSNAAHTTFLGADGESTLIEDKLGNDLVAGIGYTNLGAGDGSFALPINESIVNVTLPGGVVRYRLEVSNKDANGPISNIVLIDKLPGKGDTGVIVNSERGSGWSPYLASDITLRDKEGHVIVIDESEVFTVFYSTAVSPDYDQLYNPTTTYSADHGDWSINLPKNITDVTHIKIQIKQDFAPNDEVIVEWDMKAPYDVPVQIDGKDNIAWNSFAYAATFESIDSSENTTLGRFLPAEPIKVGVRIGETTLSELDRAIGNFIWHDEDRDGIQDENEVGINDIPVKLYYSGTSADALGDDLINEDQLLEETYTGPNNEGKPGYYYFPNLGNGFYRVEYEMPDGFYITTLNVGEADPANDPANDSDFTKVGATATHRSHVVELNANDTDKADVDVDSGIYRQVSLGNYVWDDYDLDGIQEDGEPGINGVKVTLYKNEVAVGDPVYTTSKNGNPGYYEFKGLVPGEDYTVRFDLNDVTQNATLENYSYTNQNQGDGDEQDNLDSDGGVVTVDDKIVAETGNITLLSNISKDDNGEFNDLATDYLTNSSIDQGIKKGVIGDYIWNDQDVNGIQEGNEHGLNNITVKLLVKNDEGTYVAAKDPTNLANDYVVTTDENGKYLFTRLDNGDYKVDVDLANGSALRPTKLNEGGDDALDSDGDLVSFTTGVINIANGATDLRNDMGFYYQGILGNFVWEDKNGNGIQDTYDHDHDSSTPAITEPGINGVTVNLYHDNDDEGVELNNIYSYADHMEAYKNRANPTTTADKDGEPGYYFFDDLYFDTYKLVVTKPAGFDAFTLKDISENSKNALDSDADEAGVIGTATIGTGQYEDLTYDAGVYKYASLGNKVWYDYNMDGIQGTYDHDNDLDTAEIAEPPVVGVNVQLTASRGTVYNDTTDANGEYSFTNLPPDTYTLLFTNLPENHSVSTINQGNDDSNDSDGVANQVQDTSATISDIVLYSGEDDQTQDLGLYKSFSLGDYVWEDMTNDGLQTGELANGINGVKLALYTSTGTKIAETTTSLMEIIDNEGEVNGGYKFEDLPLGSYYIEVIDSDTIDIDQDYEVATANVGADNTIDNDAEAIFNKTETITFTTASDQGYHNPSLDVGLYKFAKIGDYVFEDKDYDGTQSDGDTAISGTVVNLYIKDTITLVATDTTDPNGNYLFDKVAPGTYDIKFIIPNNYTATDSDQGGDDKFDSDGVVDTFADSSSLVEDITVQSGTDDRTHDLGLYKSFSIGDKTWLDKDGNGLQDENEVVSGITLELYKYDGDNQNVTDGFKFSAKNSSNIVASSVVSANDGSYIFQDLPKGKYYVVASTLSYKMTILNVGDVNTVDSNFNQTAFVANHYKTLAADPYLFDNDTADNERYNQTVDAGFFELAGLGNKIWEDQNYNGIQDNGEPGVANVVVELYKHGSNALEATQTTTDTGEYMFTELDPARYTIKFTYPDSYFVTLPNETTDADGIVSEDVDSDGIHNNGTYSATIDYNQLYSGESITNLDLGLYKEASVGDLIWKDTNKDGIQDTNEPYFGAATVKIYKVDGDTLTNPYGNGSPTGTDLTGEDGIYGFAQLKPGDYRLVFTIPGDYSVTTKNATGNANDNPDLIDSDIEANKAIDTEGSIDFTLASGENNLSIDLGLYNSFTLGDTIFEDTNANGVQDDGEPGIQGVTIYLYTSGSDPSDGDSHIASTTSDLNGEYSFTDLSMGTYFIKVVPKNGYVFTQNEVGGNTLDSNLVDSDVDQTTGVSESVTFNKESAQNNPTLDAGMYVPATIGDYVWLDANKDGLQTGEVTGVEDVEVYLYAQGVEPSDVNHYKTTTTNASGAYSFTGVKPGSYFVVFKNFPDNYAVSPLTQGADTNVDSDGNVASDLLHTKATTGVITVDSGDTNNSLDLGLYSGFSIGDFVWYDLNADGIHDNTEVGYDGITLELYKQVDDEPKDTDPKVATDVTDVNGGYLFDGLPLGTYYVKIITSNLNALSEQDAGDDEAVDSDFHITKYISHSHTFEADSAISNLKIDAGLYKYVGLGNKVFIDANYNGIDDNEDGVPNVTVKLYQGETLKDTKITNNDGIYSFSGLKPGDYKVVIEVPDDYNITKTRQGNDPALDSNGTLVEAGIATSETITILGNETNETIDFGIFKFATVGDLVFHDVERDGDQDVNDIGIAGVKVELIRVSDSAVIKTTTSAVGTDTVEEGSYEFTNVYPGDYTVRFSDIPLEYSVTVKDGADDALDSDASSTDIQTTITTTAVTSQFDVVSGEDEDTIDLGLYKNFSIGDTVWKDTIFNGILDNGDTLLEGMTMYLYSNGDEVGVATPIAEDTTDADGKYKFENLKIGEYFVYAAAEDYLIINQNQGNGANDSDFDANRKSGTISFTAETADDQRYNDSIDLGVYKLAGLGNKVWADTNANGIQDLGEIGFVGIPVRLLDSEGSQLDTTTTGAGGIYNFTGLSPSTYTVEFTLPNESYHVTKFEQGSDIEADSNGVLVGEKVLIQDYVLTEGQTITSLDIGLYQLGSIGDYVWYDTNRDGIQDDGEEPVTGGVIVEISGEGITRSMEVNEEGKYLFEDLVPGTYNVRFNRITNYRMSPANEGANDGIDSDPNSGGIVENINLESGQDIVVVDAGIYYSPAPVSTPTPTPTPEATEEPEEVEPTPEVIPTPVPTETPIATLAPTPTPEAPTPPGIKEIKPEVPTVDIPEEEKPKERIFTVDEEVDEVSVLKEPEHGSVVVDEGKNIIYTPDDSFDGTDSIVVLIEDGDDEFIMEIDIFEEDIAEAQLAELPATGGVATSIYYLVGSILAMAGIVFKKKY